MYTDSENILQWNLSVMVTHALKIYGCNREVGGV